MIFRAEVKDAEMVSALAIKTFWESHGHSAEVYEIESYVANNLNLQKVRDELADPRNLIFLIEYNSEVVGFSMLRMDMQYEKIPNENVTKLDRIYVLESHHGLKLGLELIDHAIELSKLHGQHGMWLYTWIENLRAVAFYKKKGFKIIDSADFKISDTHSNPNHIMYLEFD